jgi:hypothetical protein
MGGGMVAVAGTIVGVGSAARAEQAERTITNIPRTRCVFILSLSPKKMVDHLELTLLTYLTQIRLDLKAQDSTSTFDGLFP